MLSEHGQKDDIKLKPGSYSYPFSNTLPLGIPSSYEAHIGRIRYCIKAQIDRPWAFDDKTKAFFTVSSLFDLNTRPELLVSLLNFLVKWSLRAEKDRFNEHSFFYFVPILLFMQLMIQYRRLTVLLPFISFRAQQYYGHVNYYTGSSLSRTGLSRCISQKFLCKGL